MLDELGDSALFALRFRQNAARAPLLPRGKPGQRAPLWLQRLRGRDLLQVARRHADFPVVAETFRECLHDHLDVPRLQQLLRDVHTGDIQVVTQRRELPSPFAAGLVFSFTAAFMYQYDGVESEGRRKPPTWIANCCNNCWPPNSTGIARPAAINQVERRLRGVGQPPRTVAEMAEWLRRLGDLTPANWKGRWRASSNSCRRRGGRSCLNCRVAARRNAGS